MGNRAADRKLTGVVLTAIAMMMAFALIVAAPVWAQDSGGASEDQYPEDGQYDNNADDDGVINDTVPDKPLPNTGGMPLSGLPLSGLLLVSFALVCGGSVVLRSGIRRKE
jgi:hypothetical protein